jgi:hypothetical protein
VFLEGQNCSDTPAPCPGPVTSGPVTTATTGLAPPPATTGLAPPPATTGLIPTLTTGVAPPVTTGVPGNDFCSYYNTTPAGTPCCGTQSCGDYVAPAPGCDISNTIEPCCIPGFEQLYTSAQCCSLGGGTSALCPPTRCGVSLNPAPPSNPQMCVTNQNSAGALVVIPGVDCLEASSGPSGPCCLPNLFDPSAGLVTYYANSYCCPLFEGTVGECPAATTGVVAATTGVVAAASYTCCSQCSVDGTDQFSCSVIPSAVSQSDAEAQCSQVAPPGSDGCTVLSVQLGNNCDLVDCSPPVPYQCCIDCSSKENDAGCRNALVSPGEDPVTKCLEGLIKEDPTCEVISFATGDCSTNPCDTCCLGCRTSTCAKDDEAPPVNETLCLQANFNDPVLTCADLGIEYGASIGSNIFGQDPNALSLCDATAPPTATHPPCCVSPDPAKPDTVTIYTGERCCEKAFGGTIGVCPPPPTPDAYTCCLYCSETVPQAECQQIFAFDAAEAQGSCKSIVTNAENTARGCEQLAVDSSSGVSPGNCSTSPCPVLERVCAFRREAPSSDGNGCCSLRPDGTSCFEKAVDGILANSSDTCDPSAPARQPCCLPEFNGDTVYSTETCCLAANGTLGACPPPPPQGCYVCDSVECAQQNAQSYCSPSDPSFFPDQLVNAICDDGDSNYVTCIVNGTFTFTSQACCLAAGGTYGCYACDTLECAQNVAPESFCSPDSGGDLIPLRIENAVCAGGSAFLITECCVNGALLYTNEACCLAANNGFTPPDVGGECPHTYGCVGFSGPCSTPTSSSTCIGQVYEFGEQEALDLCQDIVQQEGCLLNGLVPGGCGPATGSEPNPFYEAPLSAYCCSVIDDGGGGGACNDGPYEILAPAGQNPFDVCNGDVGNTIPLGCVVSSAFEESC